MITDETRKGFIDVIQDLKERERIEQIILGCTELPLLLDDSTSPVPCLDTVQIHVEALVNAIVEKAA